MAVHHLSAELPRFGGDDGRARIDGLPYNDSALGDPVRAGVREAMESVGATSELLLEGRTFDSAQTEMRLECAPKFIIRASHGTKKEGRPSQEACSMDGSRCEAAASASGQADAGPARAHLEKKSCRCSLQGVCAPYFAATTVGTVRVRSFWAFSPRNSALMRAGGGCNLTFRRSADSSSA